MRVDGSATPPASEAPSRTPSPQPSPVSGGHPSPAASISTGPADTDSLSAEPGYCYVEFSDEMVAEEARLRLALVAQVGNVSAEFSPAEVLAAICVSTGLATDEFTVKPSHPEPFLVCCRSQAARDRLLASSPVPLASTMLALRPWTRLAHAKAKTLLQKVTLELVGIPPHACNLDIVSKLLAPFCWVEMLGDKTLRKEDLKHCEVHAWTDHPSAIPPSRLLRIAEKEIPVVHSDPDVHRIFSNLPPYLRSKRTLIYPCRHPPPVHRRLPAAHAVHIQ